MVNRFHYCSLPIILLIIISTSISSCTVQKRVHRKGWFIQWHHTNKKQENVRTPSLSHKADTTYLGDNKDIRSIEKSIKPLEKEKNHSSLSKFSAEKKNVPSPTRFKQNRTITDELSSDPTSDSIATSKGIPPKILPLTVGALCIFTFGFTIISIGFTLILIPIGLTFIVAMVTYLTIVDEKTGSHSFSPRKKLFAMLFVIIAIWVIALLLLFTNFNPIFPIALTAFLFFIAMVVFGRSSLSKEKGNDSKTDSTQNKTVEKTDQTTINQPQPLRKNKAFPNLTGGMVILLVLGFSSLAILLVFAAVISALGGIITASLSLLILIPTLLIIVAFTLAIIRNRNYQQYLEEFEAQKKSNTEKS